MQPEDLRRFLTERAIRVEEKPIQSATQFRCQDGEIFNVYTTGRLVSAGKRTLLTQQVDCGPPAKPPDPPANNPACSVEAISKLFFLDETYRPGPPGSVRTGLPAHTTPGHSIRF